MNRITNEQLAQMLIDYNKGHFFTIEFVKRTTGEVRKMTCRKGVHKYTKGVGLKYDAASKNLLGVWIAGGAGAEESYRMVNLDDLRSAVIDNEQFIVEA